MARKLRIQYAGALYHVINRGNYRRNIFEGPAMADAFLKVLIEAVKRFNWRLYVYVIMRNYFHLAIGAPESTLVEGMHWLQSMLATRIKRYRKESGHLFQGRYKSILQEDYVALGRVVDYIHLNSVRAKIVIPEHVAAYRWSSLNDFIRKRRAPGMRMAEWLQARECHLVDVGRDEAKWEQEGLIGLSKGWAIGTAGDGQRACTIGTCSRDGARRDKGNKAFGMAR